MNAIFSFSFISFRIAAFRRIAPLLFPLAIAFFASCSRSAKPIKPADVDYYTCTMHPSVRSQDPSGKCPICSMDLVPVKKQTAGGTTSHQATNVTPEKPHDFVVPAERQQQIGVTYALVERKPLQRRIRAAGTVQPDHSREWQFTARVDGFVQKLSITSPGEIVEKDAPLLTIYSPALLASERELVQLLQNRDRATSSEARDTSSRLIEAAERRLEQWNLTRAQITALEKSREPREDVTLLSPFRGIVKSMPLQQGQGVKIGDLLIALTDLSAVWVWADFYESELGLLKKGQHVALAINSFPGQVFEGQIGLIDPFLDETRRTAKARIDVLNPEFLLRPGMYANVSLQVDLGEGLTVPTGAIIPTGMRNIAFVDQGEGRLQPRLVQLEGEFDGTYEIQSGLTEGERVVASANFLIDAESNVQGALRNFGETEPASPAVKP